MKPTRLTQPYRKGPRMPGLALNAMLRGRSASGYNPMDVQRDAQKLAAAGQRRRQRPTRAPRPQRPPR